MTAFFFLKKDSTVDFWQGPKYASVYCWQWAGICPPGITVTQMYKQTVFDLSLSIFTQSREI